MSLTRCPDCRKRCFTDAASCPSCRQAFQPNALRAKAGAEERAFKRKYSVLVLTALLAILAALLFVVLQDYMNGTGSFHSSAISWSNDLLAL